MNTKSATPIITLLTDYGTEDGYVGAIKGVLSREAPRSLIVDISHNIQPFNYRQAAFTLMNYAFQFPRHTVHMVIVDPGVGSAREGLIVRTPDYYFIGPNNGVFSYVYRTRGYEAFRIREEVFHQPISSTFHGRDVFAPAAARIVNGDPIESYCLPVTQLSSFHESFEIIGEDEYRLKIIHVDHFGNLILNFHLEDWRTMGSPSDVRVQIDHSFLVGIKRTFSEVQAQQLLLTWDSRGFLQIAQNCGNAAHTLRMKESDHIIMKVGMGS